MNSDLSPYPRKQLPKSLLKANKSSSAKCEDHMTSNNWNKNSAETLETAPVFKATKSEVKTKYECYGDPVTSSIHSKALLLEMSMESQKPIYKSAKDESCCVSKLSCPIMSWMKTANENSAKKTASALKEKLSGNTGASVACINKHRDFAEKSPNQCSAPPTDVSGFAASSLVILASSSTVLSESDAEAALAVAGESRSSFEWCPSAHDVIPSPSPTYKKRGNYRVSFSALPPIEYHISDKPSPAESSVSEVSKDISATQTSEISKLAAEVEDSGSSAPFSTSSATSQGELKNLDGISIDSSLKPLNEADRANELLFDILEEIEADNISLIRCLDDLVSSELLNRDMAVMIYPNYKNLQPPNSNGAESVPPDESRDIIDRLLDVLTNLKLEVLEKCHKLILGKLCQLSSPKDFEKTQRKAMDDLLLHNDFTSVQRNDLMSDMKRQHEVPKSARMQSR